MPQTPPPGWDRPQPPPQAYTPPQQYGPPPQYGPPQQYGYQQFPPPPPAGRNRLWLVVGAAAVVFLLLGVGVVVVVARLTDARKATGGGQAKGFTEVWKLRYPGALDWDDRTAGYLLGSWVAGSTVVRASADEIAAYQVADGAPAWTFPAPAGTTMCGATATDSGGYIAAAYSDGTSCGTIVGLNLATGKKTFTATADLDETSGSSEPRSPKMVMAGDAVVVQSRRAATAVRVTDGSKMWSKGPGDKTCWLSDALAGDARSVAIAVSCLGLRGVRLAVLDTARGSEKWHADLPGTSYLPDIISVSPVLIRLSTGRDHLVAFDDRGRRTAGIPDTIDGVKLEDAVQSSMMQRGSGPKRYANYLVGNTMYVPTRQSVRTGAPAQGWVMAVDLTTGRRVWSSSGHAAEFRIIRADATGVLGFENGGYQRRPRLLRLAPETGAATVVGTGARAERLQLPLFGPVHEAGGTVLFLPASRLTDDDLAIVAVR